MAEVLRCIEIDPEELNRKFMEAMEQILLQPQFEVAHINTNETEGTVFPYADYYVCVESADEEPACFHVRKDVWDVTFLISDGHLHRIKTQGKDANVLKYMRDNVAAWLNAPCGILPEITNQQNAMLVWRQLHDSSSQSGERASINRNEIGDVERLRLDDRIYDVYVESEDVDNMPPHFHIRHISEGWDVGMNMDGTFHSIKIGSPDRQTPEDFADIEALAVKWMNQRNALEPDYTNRHVAEICWVRING